MHLSQAPRSPSGFDLFKQIAHQPYALFFDSQGTEGLDYIFVNPKLVFKTKGAITHIYEGDKLIETTSKPALATIKAYYDRFKLAHPHLKPVVAGIIGYEFSEQLEPALLPQPRAYATPDLIVGLYDHMVTLPSLPLCNTPTSVSLKLISDRSHQQYHDLFHTVKQHIVEGDAYQINLSMRFSTPYADDPLLLYEYLRQQGSPYGGIFTYPEGMVLSFSPEAFLNLQHRRVTTAPIKGTRRRSSEPEEDAQLQQALLNSTKDQAENVMIVDLLRNDLNRVAKPGSVKVTELCALKSFKHVHHLVSTVQAELDEDYSAFDLLQAAFPGGSITGAPKISVMNIIRKLEAHPRGPYCGSQFFIDSEGNLKSNILIRILLYENKQFYAFAGGGIVADSQADSEYHEILTKLHSFTSL